MEDDVHNFNKKMDKKGPQRYIYMFKRIACHNYEEFVTKVSSKNGCKGCKWILQISSKWGHSVYVGRVNLELLENIHKVQNIHHKLFFLKFKVSRFKQQTEYSSKCFQAMSFVQVSNF